MVGPIVHRLETPKDEEGMSESGGTCLIGAKLGEDWIEECFIQDQRVVG